MGGLNGWLMDDGESSRVVHVESEENNWQAFGTRKVERNIHFEF
jgi:hypothetical protein